MARILLGAVLKRLVAGRGGSRCRARSRMLGCLLPVLASLAVAGAARGAPADAIAVIVAADSAYAHIGRDTLADVFRRKLRLDDEGRAWVPVNLPATDALRRVFSMILFGRRPEDMEEYWNARYFHGVSPPFVLASGEAVLRFVARTPGAIGYVAGCRADARVKVVLRLPVPPESAPSLAGRCTPAAR